MGKAQRTGGRTIEKVDGPYQGPKSIKERICQVAQLSPVQ